MTRPPAPTLGDYDPSVPAIELVCDRLADLGLAVGADTARELLRAAMAVEAPRLDARIREALETSLETIRVATQSALGLLQAQDTEPFAPLVRRPAAESSGTLRRPQPNPSPPGVSLPVVLPPVVHPPLGQAPSVRPPGAPPAAPPPASPAAAEHPTVPMPAARPLRPELDPETRRPVVKRPRGR